MPDSSASLQPIAWVEQQWGTPAGLSLPLDDRALALGDGVFETLLLRDGHPQLLSAHLERWSSGAQLLQLPPPPDLRQVQAWIQAAIERSGIRSGALRLNWSRGSGGRGLVPPAQPQGRCWGTLHPHQPSFALTTTIVSTRVQRWSRDPLARCKSFNYGAMVLARQEALQAGADDALLRNSEGQLCCGSSANLLVLRQGQWHTPPLQSGCLPGVMRARALELGLARETELEAQLASSEPAVLLNSLDCRPLNSKAQPLARALFERLLGSW